MTQVMKTQWTKFVLLDDHSEVSRNILRCNGSSCVVTADKSVECSVEIRLENLIILHFKNQLLMSVIKTARDLTAYGKNALIKVDCFPLQTKNFAPAERKTNRLKRKDLRSACVSKSQAFVSYSVSKGYAVIVACAIMMIWTCVERFAGVLIDYGQAAHINIVP